MSEEASASKDDSRASFLFRLEEVCDQFEAAWKAAESSAQRPRLEDYLGDVPEPERAAVLRELIPLDIDYRRRAGEQPQAEEYRDRFPFLDLGQLTSTLKVQPATAPSEAASSHDWQAAPFTGGERSSGTPPARIRCPHCHNPIQLSDDRPDEVLCPSCGSAFRVREARQTTTTGSMRPLGKFQLLERVGLGAFGAVWRARDTELDRIVALKIPHASLLSSAADLERFHREARAAAQLRHPGIVTVHEVQNLEGLPTIVADFIHGVPLKDLLEVRRLTFREAARLIAEVAEALEYAHAMGLVHRDIKPANIMLESVVRSPSSVAKEEGAAAADYGLRTTDHGLKPLVMDFGLALRQEAEVTLTLDGYIVGTPAYMSPEQAAGKGHQADRRSDVYSLGVILYELVCGELPFRGSKMMMLHQVLHEEPRPPRRLNDKIPRDLETICLKAMAKTPARRYATAREMAEDLHRFLNGEPITARPVGTLERTWRWCRRNPGLACALSAAALFLLVGTLVSSLFAYQAQAEARRADQEATSALTQAQRANREAEIATTLWEMTALADAYQQVGRSADALRLYEEAVNLSKAKLGPDSFITLLAMQGLARAYKRPPAEIAAVEAGSAAWQKGIPTGALIEKIDNVEHPYFDDLIRKVMHCREGEKLILVYQARSEPPKTIEIEPRRRKGDYRPLIGVSPPDDLELIEKYARQPGLPPVEYKSAANKDLNPPFMFGDVILATTDPDQPDTIKPLPPNPFAPERRDYYEFYKRMVLLAGKPMIIQVRRAKAALDAPPVNIQVPPSYHYSWGMRMRMGEITALREGSSAAAQAVVARDPQQSIEGDIIKQVEVVEPDGSKHRFVTARGKAAANDRVKEVDVDPIRLPFELEQWAQRSLKRQAEIASADPDHRSPLKVTLTVFRGLEHKESTVELTWDERWRFNHETQTTPSSPMSIPELGIAYSVQCITEALEPDWPSAKAGLKVGDVLKAVRFQEWDAGRGEAVPSSKWNDLELDQWAWCFATLQRLDFKQVTFRVKRDSQSLEITVAAQEDGNWPQAERGLIRMPDLRLQKATTR